MSQAEDNKAIVGRWFAEFWGKPWNLTIVDELGRARHALAVFAACAPPRPCGVKAFMTEFQDAFPDLSLWGAGDLIAEGEHVVGRWEGGGTHRGQRSAISCSDRCRRRTGRKMHFTGTTVLRVENGKIAEEVGLDDGVTALTQLGLLRAV